MTSSLQSYQSSPSRSLAGTSMTRGLSMILAVLFPFSTMPMIQDWYPSCFSMSLQKAAACSRGSAMRSPPASIIKIEVFQDASTQIPDCPFINFRKKLFLWVYTNTSAVHKYVFIERGIMSRVSRFILNHD